MTCSNKSTWLLSDGVGICYWYEWHLSLIYLSSEYTKGSGSQQEAIFPTRAILAMSRGIFYCYNWETAAGIERDHAKTAHNAQNDPISNELSGPKCLWRHS